MRLAAALFFSLNALAQEVPEIRGTVLEFATHALIPGVQVTLSEGTHPTAKVIANTLTGANGTFSFKPGRMGEFVVQIEKGGYFSLIYPGVELNSFTLTPESPVSETQLTLMRPGELTGRVINSKNQPIAKLAVSIESSEPRSYYSRPATTDADGVFVATYLRPGSYHVHIVPTGGASPILMEYSEAASQIVDHDVESTYWPGGTLNPADSLPLTVASGARANAGTIKPREIPYYRAQVALRSECSPDEHWTYTEVRAQAGIISSTELSNPPCRKQFLLRNLVPGDLTLAFWNLGSPPVKWGFLPLHVTDHNTTAELTMSTGAQITGRILPASGTTLDAAGTARPKIVPAIQGLFNAESDPPPTPQNTFTLTNLAWGTQELAVTPELPGTYVKEIRYNGTPIPGPLFDPLPMGTLDIVLDTNAASVNGIVTDSNKPVTAAIFLLRAPIGDRMIDPVSLSPHQYFSTVDDDGKFSFASLAPGDYRILALPFRGDEWRDPASMQRLLPRAERITLERGSQRTIELKLTDPTR